MDTVIIEKYILDPYKVPMGAHGWPLPNIKTWNNAIKSLTREIKPEWKLKGSVEDLTDVNCISCDGELIRVGYKFNDIFRVGWIQCEYASRRDKPKHPKEYWAEIWPDANFPLNTLPSWINGEPETNIEKANYFFLSDPRIKRCFQRMSLEWYPFEVGLWEDWYATNRPGERFVPKPLPEPDFVHK